MPHTSPGEPREGTTMANNLNLTYAKLARIRAELNMSQVHFAAVLGIGVRTYIRFEVNERRIPGPVARLVFMLKAYGIPKELK
jgi:DNA-binding transcriptional regulator YiaG